MTTPQDNAEEKNATFILFSTTDKLTRTELKKVFRVKKGRLISTKGKYWKVGNLFNQLNAVKNSHSDEGKYFNFDEAKHVTHIYIVAQRSCTKTFGLVRYFDQFLGGYDVNPSTLKKLEVLLDEYRDVTSFCNFGKGSISGLNVRANQISQRGIGDSNRIQNLIAQLEVEFDNFANPNIQTAKEKINIWCEEHHWSDIDSQGSAQNDEQSKLAA